MGLTYWLISKLGLFGSGLAVSISQWLVLLVLVVILVVLRNSDALRGSFERPSLRELFSGWGQYMRIAAPATMSLVIEWGGWEVFASLSAQLGTIALACQSIMATTCALFYILPLGMSQVIIGFCFVSFTNAQAISTLVGNSLGEKKAKDAQSCVALGYVWILSLAVLSAVISWLCRNVYPLWFSNDPEVVAQTSQLFVMFAVYTVFDSAKCVGMGLLRATGRPTMCLLGVFLSQCVVGYPLAFLLRSIFLSFCFFFLSCSVS